MLYHQNSPLEYKSPSIHANDIETWVRKKLGPQIESLLSVTDVDEAISAHKVAAIYFGNPHSEEFQLLSAIALGFDDIYFGHTQDSRAFRKYYINVDADHTLVVFKHFDDKRADYKGPWDFGQEIAQFLYEEQFPLVLEFSATSAEKIFTEKKPYLFLLLGKGTEGLQHLQMFHSLAKRFKQKGIGLCISKLGGELNDRLLEILGVSEGKDQFPVIIYLQPGEEEPQKFRMSGEINENNVKQFIKQVRQGNEEQIRRSEGTSESENDVVVKIVGANWKGIILDDEKDVVVLIVTDWCSLCEDVQKEFRNAARVYQNQKNIVFGILNYDKNEIEGLKVENFPLIKFYPANDKSGKFNVAGKYDKSSLVKFLKTHHTVGFQKHSEQDEL